MDEAGLTKDVVAELGRIVGDGNISCADVDLIAYSRDWSLMPSTALFKPDIVIRPKTVEHIAEIMRLANERHIPVVPWGGGTGLSGGALAIKGGIMLDMKGLSRVLQVDEENLTVTTQTGITVKKLNDHLERHDLWWPHDPESKPASTVGGAISCDNVGTFGTRYGSMVDFLLGLEVVLPTGEIVKFGSKAPYTSSGYKLHWVFIGAEGTLGVVTAVTLRVYQIPSYRCIDIIGFKSIEAALTAGLRIINTGLSPESIHIVSKDGFLSYTKPYQTKYGTSPEFLEALEAAMMVSFAGLEEVAEFQRGVMARVC